tara:strand:+ start:891 stop:1439 length:549 start_codon:yes stop_codon:yes gene_type:complete
MNQIISNTLDDILKKNIYEELLTYNNNYNIDIDNYKIIITDLINKKYNFKIKDPYEIKELKNEYQKIYNKRPKGRLANDIDWLNKKISNIQINEVLNNKLDKTNYKPRYVSRNQFNKKINKCMARLWNDHYGGQCSHNKKEKDYCMVHYKLIKKRGILQFGRIDELKPERDYYNNNKLNWKN